MTQRIFDVNNPQDVKDLFNLFPEKIQKIEVRLNNIVAFLDKDNLVIELSRLFCINWRDKTKITRPVDESQWIGKLCWFSNSGASREYIDILKTINKNLKYRYLDSDGVWWSICRPVRCNEVKFVDDEK